MHKFIVVADSTCDLSKEIREQYGIEYVAGTFTYPDGKEEVSFLDWSDCKNIPDCNEEKFYAMLKKYPDGFTTSPPPAQVFYERFKKYVQDGYGVLALSISSAVSGTFGFMHAAKKQLDGEGLGADVYVVDSKRYGSANGLLAIYAAIARSEGKSLKETYDYVERIKLCLHQAGTLDDLSFLAKKGRMTNAKAFFGTLIGIKPMADLDSGGMTTVIGKVKGAKLAHKVALSYMEEVGVDLENQVILVAQSIRRSQAEEFKRLIEQKFHPRAVHLTTVFPSDGINMGPGLMAAYYMGKPVTEGLVAERAAFERAVEKNK